MATFKAGDKVYCPMFGTEVYTLKEHPNMQFSTMLKSRRGTYETFTETGTYHIGMGVPSIFHATPENRKKLEDLYGVEFETPEPEMVKIGNFEFPKPETEPLQEGETFYVPFLDGWCETFNWYSRISYQETLLENGLVHKTKEAAEQHAKVLIAISQAKTSLET